MKGERTGFGTGIVHHPPKRNEAGHAGNRDNVTMVVFDQTRAKLFNHKEVGENVDVKGPSYI